MFPMLPFSTHHLWWPVSVQVPHLCLKPFQIIWILHSNNFRLARESLLHSLFQLFHSRGHKAVKSCNDSAGSQRCISPHKTDIGFQQINNFFVQNTSIESFCAHYRYASEKPYYLLHCWQWRRKSIISGFQNSVNKTGVLFMEIIFISENFFTPLRVFSHLVPLMAKVTCKRWNQSRKKQLLLSCWSDNKLEPVKFPLKHQTADIKNSTVNYWFLSIMRQLFLKNSLRLHFTKSQKCYRSV